MKLRFALPLVVVAVSVAGAVRADERGDAEKALEKAIAAKDKDAVKTALGQATSAGDARAAKVILAQAPKCKGLDVHQPLVKAIRGIKDEAGVKELAGAARTNGNAELRYLLIEGLALQGSDAAAKAVLDAIDNEKEEFVLNAAARSARWLRGPDTVDRLIARLEKAEPKSNESVLARELNGALAALTGENLSFALEWKGWWMSHKEGWKPKNDVPSGDADDDTVVDRLKRERPSDMKTMERLADDDVIVVRGKSDSVSALLKAINIKHKEVLPEDFKNLKLDPKSVVIIPCNSDDNPYGDPEFTKIREFVEGGGYLFTSDWQLDFLLTKVFANSVKLDKKSLPEGYVQGKKGGGGKKGGKKGDGEEEEEKKGGNGGGGNPPPPPGGGNSKTSPITIKPASGKHPLMRDVFPATSWDASTFVWQLDNWSHLIKLLSSDVVVLVESPELQKKYENGAVAVTFRWHKGKVVPQQTATKKVATGGGEAKSEPEGGSVLHVLGHFKNQKDKNSGDKFALQQLLLNFILEKQRARRGG